MAAMQLCTARLHRPPVIALLLLVKQKELYPVGQETSFASSGKLEFWNCGANYTVLHIKSKCNL